MRIRAHRQFLRASITIMLVLAGCRAVMGASVQPRIEDPDGSAMRAFYESLRLTEGGESITRIVHYGDSHVAADILTGALRKRLQGNFGDAGSGFVPAGLSWKWYSRPGIRNAASPGWRVTGLSPAELAADGRHGLAGVSLSARRSGEWIRTEAACRYFEIYLLKQPGGGSVDILLDGTQVINRLSLASSQFEPAYVEVEADTDQPHALELRIASPGEVRIFGVVAECDVAGVVYEALGINGARAYLPLTWDEELLAHNLAYRSPDLIIITYGSNEVSDADLDLAVYGRRFLAMLNRFRQAVPGASILVISPPDRAQRSGGRWQAIRTMPGLVAAQRRAALGAGAAFWDLFHAMGGSGSIEGWARRLRPLAQPDRVHLTSAGYRIVAEMLYGEFIRGYRSHTSNNGKSGEE